MTYMTGPGGPGHCTRMDCLDKAVTEVTVSVHHPPRQPYENIYPFCAEHGEAWAGRLHKYPNFTIIKETTL